MDCASGMAAVWQPKRRVGWYNTLLLPSPHASLHLLHVAPQGSQQGTH